MGRGLPVAYNLVPLMVAAGANDRLVAEELGLSDQGVRAFRRRRGLSSRHRQPTRRAPSVEALVGRTVVEVAHAHRCRYSVARRWFADHGIEPASPRKTASPRTSARARLAYPGPAHTEDEAERAVRVLRGRYPSVHRCDIRLRERSSETFGDRIGLPDKGRGWWWIATVGAVDRDTLLGMVT